MNAFDRMARSLFEMIRMELVRVDYYALYPCTVVAQRSDLSLDLRPDDPKKITAPTGVRVRGLPGVTVKVSPGARVLLGWLGGDPSQPYACLAEPSGLLELVISAGVKVSVSAPTVNVTASAQASVSAPVVVLADGGQPIARVGDTVTCTGTAGPFPAVVTGIISSGNPKVLA